MRSRLMGSSVVLLASLLLSAGCQSGSSDGGVLRAGIPPKAMRVQEGSGQLVYTADRAGRVYLYNASQDQMVEAIQVRSGQRLAVDAAAGRATLDSNEISVGKLNRGATYRIYFLPSDPN